MNSQEPKFDPGTQSTNQWKQISCYQDFFYLSLPLHIIVWKIGSVAENWPTMYFIYAIIILWHGTMWYTSLHIWLKERLLKTVINKNNWRLLLVFHRFLLITWYLNHSLSLFGLPSFHCYSTSSLLPYLSFLSSKIIATLLV